MSLEAEERNNYICINCRHKSKSLFKRYSETVLKLTECEICNQITDKYVEYDTVIIILDLVLLNIKASRHILLNTDFKNFWKLAVFLILVESYSNWSLTQFHCNNEEFPKINKTEQPKLEDFDMINVEDIKFYVITVKIALGYVLFISVIYAFSIINAKFLHSESTTTIIKEVSLTLIIKTVTLSSIGIFLHLPSVIWDLSLYNYHLNFITLYIWLSQLLAYRVISESHKIWCLLVIFSAHTVKIGFSSFIIRKLL